MADVATAKKERSAAKGRFTRTNKSVNNAITNKLATDTIESRFQDLLTAWNNLQDKHEKYIVLEAEPADDAEDTYLDTAMTEFEITEVEKNNYKKGV